MKLEGPCGHGAGPDSGKLDAESASGWFDWLGKQIKSVRVDSVTVTSQASSSLLVLSQSTRLSSEQAAASYDDDQEMLLSSLMAYAVRLPSVLKLARRRPRHLIWPGTRNRDSDSNQMYYVTGTQ